MPERCLVVTDMDGTLLNHHDYRVDAARPMLAKLQQASIPVIFNTSKTLAELLELVRQLDNQHPFIVENGSAIYIPRDYFPPSCMPAQVKPSQIAPDYLVLVMGMELDAIQAFVDRVQPAAINFIDCTLEQAMQLTGLDRRQVESARSRQFSIPLWFSDTADEQDFAEQAIAAGFGVLRGGRFLHVLGSCDKGKSMLALRRLYRDCAQTGYTLIALGDSPNDLLMLQQADIAVLVKSPSSATVALDHSCRIDTAQTAPEGWVEGVQAALNQLSITLEE